jgi:hypothetical protein
MNQRNLYHNGIALALYLLLSTVFTYPLVFHMDGQVAGMHDVWHYVWNLWWVKKSIFEMHASPYYTDLLFYPTGIDLRLYELMLPSDILALPFQSPVFAYNVLCLLSFILGGFGMFLLARYVVNDDTAAFVSGIIYAFAPYHFFEVSQGHLNLLSIQWIPFYILYLLKTVRQRELKNTFYTVFFLLLVTLSTWQYALYTLVFTLLYLGCVFLNDKRRWRESRRRLFLFGVLYLLAVSPFLLMSVSALLTHEYVAKKSLAMVMYYSADVLGFLLPSGMHPVYGASVNSLLERWTGGVVYTTSVSLGYVTMVLALLYAVRKEPLVSWLRRKIGGMRLTTDHLKDILPIIALNLLLIYVIFGLDVVSWLLWFCALAFSILLFYALKERAISFWMLSAIFFWVLSLGPIMQFMGREYFPLPSILLMAVPLIRAPYRAVVILNLSVALLAGMGVAELRKIRRGVFMPGVVSFLLLLEFAAIPLPLSDAAVPRFYYELRGERGDFAVLDVQVSPLYLSVNDTVYSYDLPWYSYYQTVHGKPIVGGTVGFYTEVTDFLDNTPVLYELRHPGVPDVVRQNLSAVGNGILSHFNIRYVVLHPPSLNVQDEFEPNSSRLVNGTLFSIFSDSDIAYHDSDILVFRVRESETPLFMTLGSGWQVPLNGSRWMGSRAELFVVSQSALATTVCFDVFSTKAVTLDAGGRKFAVDEVPRQYALPVELESGSNAILFTSPDGCLLDDPCRSFAFTSISIGPCSSP